MADDGARSGLPGSGPGVEVHALNASTGTCLLIVDGDPEHGRQFATLLGRDGYQVRVAHDAQAMAQALSEAAVGLVILDAQLPNGDGLTMCRRLAETGGPAVILMGAGQDEIERIIGLEIGADDYVAKSVHPRELLARVRVAVRRNAERIRPRAPTEYRSGGLELDVLRRELRSDDGTTQKVTPTEVSLLVYFLVRQGEPVTRADLREFALRDDRLVLDKAVETAISRLRRKLRDFTGSHYIQTIHGTGYVWNAG